MSENEESLKVLLQQEEDLQFDSFSNERALEVGLALLEEVKKRGQQITINITKNGQQIFHYAMEGTAIDNGEWVRRKNNVVQRFGHSSFYVGSYLRSSGQSIEEKYLIASSEYAAHGGAFPLIIRGVGMVGNVTVSGLPQREDHELVVSVLRRFVQAKNS